MSMMKKLTDSWQDTLSLALGIWLLFSPWLLGFTPITGAYWNAIAFGLVIAGMSLLALIEFHEWEEWADMAVGAWLVVSPWVLGFAIAANATVVWNVIIVGLAILGMAAWSLRDHRHQTHA